MNEATFTATTNKLKFLASTSFFFVASIGAAYFLHRGPDPSSLKIFLREPGYFYPIFAIGTLLLFALSIAGVYRLIADAPGLTADRDGINLNGSLFVPWADISTVERYYDFTTPSLNGYKIILKDPERFLAEHKRHKMYKRMASNYGMLSTPVAVYTNSLRIDHERFASFVEHSLRKGG